MVSPSTTPELAMEERYNDDKFKKMLTDLEDVGTPGTPANMALRHEINEVSRNPLVAEVFKRAANRTKNRRDNIEEIAARHARSSLAPSKK